MRKSVLASGAWVGLAMAAAQAQGPSTNLSGEWRVGSSSSVVIVQTGQQVKATWKVPSRNCDVGALWLDGTIEGSHIVGTRYACADRAQNSRQILNAEILDEGKKIRVTYRGGDGTTLTRN
jgi:hypothetical protein